MFENPFSDAEIDRRLEALRTRLEQRHNANQLRCWMLCAPGFKWLLGLPCED